VDRNLWGTVSPTLPSHAHIPGDWDEWMSTQKCDCNSSLRSVTSSPALRQRLLSLFAVCIPERWYFSWTDALRWSFFHTKICVWASLVFDIPSCSRSLPVFYVQGCFPGINSTKRASGIKIHSSSVRYRCNSNSSNSRHQGSSQTHTHLHRGSSQKMHTPYIQSKLPSGIGRWPR